MSRGPEYDNGLIEPSSRFPVGSTGNTSLDAFGLGFLTRCLVGGCLLPFNVVKARAEAGLSRDRSTLAALTRLYQTAKWRGTRLGLCSPAGLRLRVVERAVLKVE